MFPVRSHGEAALDDGSFSIIFPSRPFNPLLGAAFFWAGSIEAWGRGIEKIRRECRERDIEPPTYDCGMAGLMVTFHEWPRFSADGGLNASTVLGPSTASDHYAVDRLFGNASSLAGSW